MVISGAGTGTDASAATPGTADSRTPAPAERRGLNRPVALNQLLFAGVTIIVIAVVQIFLPASAVSPLFFLGIVVVFLATGAAVAVPWHKLAPGWVAVLPVLDILAIIAIRDAVPTIGAGLLWVFPVIWMSVSFGMVGAVVSVGLTVIGLALNIVLAPVPSSMITISAVVLLPLTLAVVSALSSITAKRSAAQQRLLRKQARLLEGALGRARQQEALVAGVLDAVDFGVIRIDADRRVTYMNEIHARLLRASSPTLHARGPRGDSTAARGPAVEVYDADGVQPLAAEERPFARALRGEEFDGVIVWIGEPGGERVALSLTARRLPGDHAGIPGETDAGAVLVSRDVTAELTAVRARDDLVASVSHELRTPLTSIMGFLDLTLDEELPPAARANLQIAERNTTRLLELVSDILAASTRGSGALSIARQSSDLAAITRDSVASLAPSAAQRGISFDTAAVEPTQAVVDPFRMRQVIDNLISNAIKYNRENGEISVGVTSEDDQAWVIVRDSGIGVSETELPRLFDRYFRSETVRRSSTHGSGLGLGISRDIVRLHGGELTLHSVVDEGTTVIVRLPKEPS